MQIFAGDKGARNPTLQVVIPHASHVCSQHLFGLPLKMNGMHKTQYDHARFDVLPLVLSYSCFDHLSSETCTKHNVGAKACGPPIVVARTS